MSPAAVAGWTLSGMNATMWNRILLTVTILYGLSVGVLYALIDDFSALYAVVGALVVGALWAVRGVWSSRGKGPADE